MTQSANEAPTSLQQHTLERMETSDVCYQKTQGNK